MEHGTHSTQGCKKASGKEVGKKLQRTENPLVQQTSLGWSLMPCQETVPSSRQAMHWLAAIPTPQNCRTRWFTSRYRFHCQNSPTRVASLLGSEEQQYNHTYCAKSTAKAECTGAGLGRMTQLHQKAAALSPAYWNPLQILPRCSLSLPYFGP